jgi:dienelactone hydrolase
VLTNRSVLKVVMPMALIFSILVTFSCAAELPAPSGKYSVGTAYLSFTDTSRNEIFTDDSRDVRTITGRIWYPAKNEGNGETAYYFPEADQMANQFNMPNTVVNLKTNSHFNLPLVDSPAALPVLIYSHGWGEYAEHYSSLMEELASRGYIVVSIAHHYEAKFWGFPETGMSTIAEAGSALQERLAEQRKDSAFSLFTSMPDLKTIEQQRELVKNATRLMPKFFSQSPRIWADDIIFIVNQLHDLNNRDGLFYNRMDLEKIGAIGMSMGGIASVLAGTWDNRIKAVVNLDGGLYGDVVDSAIRMPLLYVSSERYRYYGDFFLSRAVAPAYAVMIAGSDHQNFSDLPLCWPQAPLIGSIEQDKMNRIVRRLVFSFFEKYLNGKPGISICEFKKEFPEIFCESSH